MVWASSGRIKRVCGPTQVCYRSILQLNVACPNDFHGAGSKSAEICPSGDLPDKLEVPAVMCQWSPPRGPAAERGAVLILAYHVRARGGASVELRACPGLGGCCFRGMDHVCRIRALRGPETSPGGHSQVNTGTHLILREKDPQCKPLENSLAPRILGKEAARSNTAILL